MTDAVKQLGLPSVRFSREDGDLSTIAGRAKLWSLIERTQPEHIWVAPECGPWSGWNHLNQQKSMSMFDTIQNKQREQLPHLQLCQTLSISNQTSTTFSLGTASRIQFDQARCHDSHSQTCDASVI